MIGGLQILDENENVIMDISDRVGRVLGIVRIGAGSSGSLVYSNYDSGQLFASFQRDASTIVGQPGQQAGALPVFSVSGNTITWVTNSQYVTWLGNVITVTPIGGWLTVGVY